MKKKYNIILAVNNYPDQDMPSDETVIATAYSKGIAYIIMDTLTNIYTKENEILFID